MLIRETFSTRRSYTLLAIAWWTHHRRHADGDGDGIAAGLHVEVDVVLVDTTLLNGRLTRLPVDARADFVILVLLRELAALLRDLLAADLLDGP